MIPPIIFLDIDGVLCTNRSHLAFGRGKGGLMLEWDPTGCALIARLCREHRAQIVVSSTWRLPCHVRHSRPRLKKHGLRRFLHPDWRTPDLRRGFQQTTHRGNEIKSWLLSHPGVRRYCIVDDSYDMLAEQDRHFCLVRNSREGFGYEHYKRVADILGADDGAAALATE